jgi:hypothetical protein
LQTGKKANKMSRHKLVKNLDLDDELDDYDGGEEYGDDGVGGEGLFPRLFVCVQHETHLLTDSCRTE